MQRRFSAALVLIACITCCAADGARATSAPLPVALAHLVAFHGQLRYAAHPVDDPSDVINGSLEVDAGGWVLEETSAGHHLHASSRGSWLQTQTMTLAFDDALRVDALANSWAVVLANAGTARLQRDAGGSSWTSPTGVRIYLDAAGTQILGASDLPGGVAYSYGDWTQADGLDLPRSIVRLRGGTPDGSYVIDDYQAQWSSEPAAASAIPVDALPVPARAVRAAAAVDASARGLGLFDIMLVLAGCAVLVALWLRRDALIERISRRVAQDPRAWKHAGVTGVVSPEGLLTFQGCSYRIGPLFFNRPVIVQTSPLFIKVSAPGEARSLILARKFASPLPGVRRAQAGFTLIESLTASMLFATVIVAAVFPALIVLAHADAIAARHELALRIAANALTDEEAALAYAPAGSAISDDAKVAVVSGMTVSERVETATSLSDLHRLTIDVRDAAGQSLAHLVTMVGPPVPPPASIGSPPPGAP